MSGCGVGIPACECWISSQHSAAEDGRTTIFRQELAMRIWDVSPEKLCHRHLLGEHRELHAIWAILTQGKNGYSNHPEILRWKGKLKSLYSRHEKLVEEMKRRGYRHQSPLAIELATGDDRQSEFVNSYEEQVEILKKKKCGCEIECGTNSPNGD